MKNWLFKTLFADKYRLMQQLALAHARHTFTPARFRLEGGLPEEEVADRLAGTAETPVIQALVAVLDRKIVEMSDRATNAPSEINTPELRTYEAGGANAIAELKTRLADLTAPREEKKKPEAAP